MGADHGPRPAGGVGAVLWMTGLPGAGKTTLAAKIETEVLRRGRFAVVLDGDALRAGLNADLSFSPVDRAENVRRVAEVARLAAASGAIAIVALISPYRHDRAHARAIVSRGASGIPFVEIFVDAPLEVCERRDPKGLYARARAGAIASFTGVSAPYEPPDAPDLAVRTGVETVDASVASALSALDRRLSWEPA